MKEEAKSVKSIMGVFDDTVKELTAHAKSKQNAADTLATAGKELKVRLRAMLKENCEQLGELIVAFFKHLAQQLGIYKSTQSERKVKRVAEQAEADKALRVAKRLEGMMV